MTTIELKRRVIEKIENIHEDALLKEVLALLDFETDSTPFTLSDKQKSAIEISRKQIRNGESNSHGEVMQEVEKWLKE